MDQKVRDALKNWLFAKRLVSENPRLLKEDLENSSECRRRLDLLMQAEQELRGFSNSTIPPALREWIKKPPPACECLNHVYPSKQHPDCLRGKRSQVVAELELRKYVEQEMPLF